MGQPITLSLPTCVEVELGCDHYHCRLGVSRLPYCFCSSVPPSTTNAISKIDAESGNGLGLILHIITAKTVQSDKCKNCIYQVNEQIIRVCHSPCLVPLMPYLVGLCRLREAFDII